MIENQALGIRECEFVIPEWFSDFKLATSQDYRLDIQIKLQFIHINPKKIKLLNVRKNSFVNTLYNALSRASLTVRLFRELLITPFEASLKERVDLSEENMLIWLSSEPHILQVLHFSFIQNIILTI